MAYFEANGLQFEPLPVGVSPTALVQGIYHDTGRYGPAPVASRPIYQDDPLSWPGVDGVVIVRHGFRGRLIFATLVFAGPLSFAHSEAKDTLETLASNTRYTISMPEGASYDGCKLQEAGQGSFINMSGGVLLFIPAIFNQFSLTN